MKTSWDDKVNPIMLKDLRQMFNSNMLRLVMVVVIVLLGLMIAAVLKIVDIDDIPTDPRYFSDMGQTLYICTWYGIIGTSLLMGGLAAMIRYMRERSQPDIDVGNFTSMSPLRMVTGRLLSSIVTSLYVGSISLPCLVVGYLLGGVSPMQIVWSMFMLLPLILLLEQIALFGAAYGNVRVLCLMIVGGVVIVPTLAYPSYLLIMTEKMNIWLFLLWLLIIALNGLVYVLHVAYLSAETSNKTLPIKIYLFACFAVILLVIIWLSSQNDIYAGDKEQYYIACLCAWQAFLCLLAILAGLEPWHASLRVRESCPSSFIGRLGFYLLSNVAGSSLLLLVVLQGIGLIVAQSLNLFLDSNLVTIFTNATFYSVCYSAITLSISQWYHRKTRTELLCATAAILNAVPVILVLFLVFWNSANLRDAQSVSDIWYFHLLLPSALYPPVKIVSAEDAHQTLNWAIKLMGIWFACGGLLLIIKPLITAFNRFTKPTDDEKRSLQQPQAAQTQDFR